MNNSLDVVILAAGRGTRMRSQHPKVLHSVAGMPMLEHVLRTLHGLHPARVVVVVGHGADAVRSAMKDRGLTFALQDPPQGTGHALLCARSVISAPHIVVLPGDVPLLPAEALKLLLNRHREADALLTLLTTERAEPGQYGRVLRDESGAVTRVVEAADATDEERSVREVNAGVYCMSNCLPMWQALETLLPDNAQGEVYITDLVKRAAADGRCAAVTWPCETDLMGINDRCDLAQAEGYLRQRILQQLMVSGVTVVDPGSTYVSPEAEVNEDTVLYPNTHIYGKCRVGRGCSVGPGAHLEDTELEDGVTTLWSMLEGAWVGTGARVGPYAHLRPGARIGPSARVGNFVEVKAASLGNGAKANHLAYIGDATVGAGANIGAGTITCNYDGTRKHHTHIGGGAFIGSNTALVAPVRVGENAVVGAGSVIDRDVPPYALALGRAPQVVKEDWNRDREVT